MVERYKMRVGYDVEASENYAAPDVAPDGAWVRYSDYEAALRAAVPEGEPVVKPLEWHGPDFEDEYYAYSLERRYTIGKLVEKGRWLGGVGGYFTSVDEAKAAAQADYDQRIRSALVSAPRPDMERELAEARNHVAELELERERFATENLALAADNARLVEALGKLEKAATVVSRHGAQTGSWWSDLTTGLIYARAAISRAALSGASIPAPDKAEARREALDAARYRWLREQHWNEDVMSVVCNPKKSVRLGSYCPSGQLLDEAIDAAIAAIRAISNPARREGE